MKLLLERLDTYLFLLNHLADALTTKPGNLLFPFSTHISEILSLKKSQYFNYENILVFSLSVPTPSKEEFTLFKPHSIPMFLNHVIYIKTQAAYVALSKNNQTYYHLMSLMNLHQFSSNETLTNANLNNNQSEPP